MIKYQTSISDIGELAMELFESSSSLILFDDSAPEELKEISVVHKNAPLKGEISKGDQFIIGNKAYTIQKVGSEVNHTLQSQGHCTIVFGEKGDEFLPGQIIVSGTIPPKISPGDRISFQ